MLKKLYLVSGGLTIDDVVRAIYRGGTVAVGMQKYTAVGSGAFVKTWEEPAQCTMRPRGMDADFAWIEAGGDVLNLSAKVVNAEAAQLTEKGRDFAGSEELVGLNLNLLYDFEQGVGVVLNGHNGSAKRAVIEEPQLDVLLGDCDELVGKKVLDLMGVPQVLQASERILRELNMLG